MKTKQVIAIIITCVIIIITGSIGVALANSINLIKTQEKDNITSSLESLFNNKAQIELPANEYIGKIDIEGTIQGGSSDNPFAVTSGYDHNLYMDFINKMMEDDNNKGILLYVDSPGGTVYHSDEMHEKLLEYKRTTNRPIYAYFASYAASGGYYIPCLADKIYANKNCWTGSIGVIISTYNYKELLDKIGVKEINFTSGENKAMGSGGEEITPEQAEIFQALVDEAFDDFVKVVANGRGLSEEAVREIADGRIYTARQAKEVGLVDEIAPYEAAVLAIENETGIDEEDFYSPKKPLNPFSFMLYGYTSKLGSDSDSDIRAAMDLMDKLDDGVLMYYAK